MKRRLLFFIPSLLFISLIGFIITINAPGDPITSMLHDSSSPVVAAIKQEQEVKLRHQLGLDLPLFYFSIHAVAEPDTLYRIYPVQEQNMLLFLTRKYGNWSAISDYYRALKNCQHDFNNTSSDTNFIDFNLVLIAPLLNVKNDSEAASVKKHLAEIKNVLTTNASVKAKNNITTLIEKWEIVLHSKPTWRNNAPAISFTTHNQFHRWLFGTEHTKGIIQGDFGTSYITRQPVLEVFQPKIKWSLLLTLLSLLISLAIAIPLAIYMVRYPSSFASKIVSVYCNFAYATPVFWFATLLLVTLANPSFIKLFPASAVPNNTKVGFLSIFQNAWYLILPLLCYCYASIALLTQTIQSSLKQTLSEPYIKTAFAKGLTERLVIYRHALPNVLLPLITLIANVFPAAISGSVIIENIFSIPGMGNEITHAIFTQNYPVLVAIVMLTGFMTLTGFLLADIFYSLADPRIRAANEK